MGKVVANVSVSLDGFVADPDDEVGPLFDWYQNGDVEVPSADPRWTFRVSAASAPVLSEAMDRVGALLCGRRLFEVARGWGGRHPTGAPVFVLTHSAPAPEDWPHEPDAAVSFVTEGGVARAVAEAQAAAGERWVAVASPNVAQQCLTAGLLDELHLDLVPVLLGSGIRLFDGEPGAPVRFDDPEVVQGVGVTHLRYRLSRQE